MFTSVILVLFVWTYPIYALAPEKCEKLPAQRYCIIEWMSRERWAHTERYTYKWDRRKCLLIRWAEYCGPPQPLTNNFESEHICYSECGGWA